MNVKSNTRNFYLERINVVVDYIKNNLSENMDIAHLAELGNYSPFHFHRIMRAYLGESLGAYIVRQRLETAVSLLRLTDESISDVAYKVGYDTPSSFNKAFKKRYSISPAEFRKNNKMVLKMNQVKFQNNAMKNLKSLEPKIKSVKPKKVIYARTMGSYNESAKRAWDAVCEFAKKKKLFGFKTEFIGISHDDPKVTDPDKLRYDACIVVSKEIKAEGEIGIQDITGGKYAVFVHKGSYELLKFSYDYIFGSWLMESGNKLRNVESFEKYLNAPENTTPEKLKTEIYIPIQ